MKFVEFPNESEGDVRTGAAGAIAPVNLEKLFEIFI